MAKLAVRSKVKVEKTFRYFFCTKKETQPSLLAGSPDVSVEVSAGDVHIVFKGRLMCGGSREAIKNGLKAESTKETDAPPKNVPFCAVCTEEFKKEPSSPWYKFVGAKNVQ